MLVNLVFDSGLNQTQFPLPTVGPGRPCAILRASDLVYVWFVSLVAFFLFRSGSEITALDYGYTRTHNTHFAMILDRVPARKQQLIMNKTGQNDAFDVNTIFFFLPIQCIVSCGSRTNKLIWLWLYELVLMRLNRATALHIGI